MNKNRKNTLAMFVGSDNQEPCVVFVRGVNQFGWLVLEEVNKSNCFFDDADTDTLLDIDLKKLELLKAQWSVDNAEKVLSRAKERYQELLEQSQ